MTHLFVYGSLAPGRANAHVLADVAGQWEPASVRGTLHASGWGAAIGFPGLVLDDQAQDVAGLLFHSDELDRHWARLDEFEGEGYRRVLTDARRGDGSIVQAWVYCLADAPVE